MNVNVVAEIGINHNGDINIAKKLIDVAVVAGCDYVKWQKRTPDACVPQHQKNQPKSTPWGDMTYLEYKKKIEFSGPQCQEIFDYCKDRIKCFASVWDQSSVDFMVPLTNIVKIPSALITDLNLCCYARSRFETLVISTGMSTEKEIETCVNACNPDVIMHTNSVYPSPIEELNLSYIQWLKDKYPDKEIGYSGHEYGLVTTFAAVAVGSQWIERHITLDRTMWGSDHLASVEPIGLMKLVKGIRDIGTAMGVCTPRKVLGSEGKKLLSLRPAI
jgi:N-acetylneuraminate synthase